MNCDISFITIDEIVDDFHFPDANQDLIDAGIIKKEDIEELIDEFGNERIIIVKKSKYTDAHRRAQAKYREKFPEKYHAIQHKVYEKKKDDPEWKAKWNEICKKNNKQYRDRKKAEQLALGVEPPKRGRPKKVIVQTIEDYSPNIAII